MNSKQIREAFLVFFKNKGHKIVPSAPMVIKNDPTLMFTNAGMNQFKDIFLGNSAAMHKRIADTQKCLRVSGKHNDLEEVGHDTYHHTMFEMLGNWSFGDYFKQEAISWAWEFLTEVLNICKDSLYVTVFGGDKEEKLDADNEAYEFWKQIIPEDRILFGNKKDNFWEMGETGPCGPCSEIHIDLRPSAEKKVIPGKDLVNTNHPKVIEIWNLVFIEFNRKADGSLILLPSKHVDTGMGFERLCMVLQKKQSNYDTDVFSPIINKIAQLSGKKYGKDEKADTAMRVAADHLRAVAFAIADGQIPSNNKAGYVIRRILRRAIRYGYTFLNFNEPFLYSLVPVLTEQMGEVFPELISQQQLIQKVIFEEETAFLNTLATGIVKFGNYISTDSVKHIDGKFAFELFDTYGFPIDLTQLIAKENNLSVDMKGFEKCMEEQKNRSKKAAEVSLDDWIEIISTKDKTEFTGYDTIESTAKIIKYRQVKSGGKEFYHVILDRTPFYAESGGQAGDKGLIISNNEKLIVEDTIKENDLIIHILKKLPENINTKFTAIVDEEKRHKTEANHSATHLLHSALKIVLGHHVEQKGSLVDDERLRFDFSHFGAMTNEDIIKTEQIVNQKIRETIKLEELRNIKFTEASELGAVALFGEKYGETVRVIAFDRKFSMELCGGTHVDYTSKIGIFKIISEGAIAAGIRRIEAITGEKAEQWINDRTVVYNNLKELLKGSKDLVKNAQQLIEENANLQKQITVLKQEKAANIKNQLLNKSLTGDLLLITEQIDIDPETMKNLAFALKNSGDNIIAILASVYENKPSLTIAISDTLCDQKNLNAAEMIREIAKEINGGGGGQKFYATAGGKNATGIPKALAKAAELAVSLIRQ